MADDKKTFTEDEHLAILSDRVTKETAELTTKVGTVEAERDDLATKLDVSESAKTAAEQERDAAKKELEDYKASIEEAREAAEKKDGRVSELREAAAHLGQDFLDEAKPEGEARVKRIVAMSDESFEAYKADMAATKPEGFVPANQPPRETAMHGTPPAGTNQPSAARSFLLGRKPGGAELIGAGASTKEN